MSNGLPQGWATASVSAVIEDLQPGFASGEKNVEGGVAHLRMNNIGLEGKLVLDLIRTVPERLAKLRHDLRLGDVLVCTTNSGKLVGKTAYFDLPGRYTFSNHLTRLRPKPDVIDGRLLRWSLWLHWQRGVFDDKCKHWVNQSNLPKAALMEDEIVVPPLAEQRRMVAKLEALLGKVDACQMRLAKIPVLLERFRQSVLSAACSGRLTADWRDDNDEIQTATELLRSVPTERKASQKRAGRLWGAGEVPQLTEDDLEGLPSTWVWTKVAELGHDPTDTVQVGPMSMQSRDFTEEGIPVLNVGCVQWTGLDESKLDHMPAEKAAAFSRYRIATNDILFTRSGTVGRCALATSRQDGWLMTFHLLRVRSNPKKCLPQYLLFVLQGSPNVLRQTTGAAIGSTRAGFNTRLLAQLDVPLPPFTEQHEIVRRVEGLFGLADQLGARFARAKVQVDKLAPSLLARAFRGELVPTEAELANREGRDYEPASALLERIRGDRAAGEEERPGKPARRTRRAG
jgi:type I restriction enzyme S subunit